MLTHLALFGLPEWTTLSKVQRQFAWQHYVVPIVVRWQLAMAKTLLVIFAVAAMLWLEASSRTSTSVIAIVAAVFLIPELFDFFFVAGHRRRIGSIIQSHDTEIRSVA